MESLPVMLQIALLLLGCALSRYLWEINTTVASVVIGMTSFGVLFYIFIVFAGTVSDSCLYQTPAANVICHVPGVIRHVLGVIRHVPGAIRRVPGLLRSAYALFVEHSALHYVFADYWRQTSRSSPSDIIVTILTYPLLLLICFVVDAIRLGRATFRFDHQTIEPNFRCISWMLQTSLDKTINMSTLKFLETILPLSDPDSSAVPAVVMDCFDILISCAVIDSGERVTVTRGSEQLARISAMCFLRAFSCLLSTEPTSTAIRDVRQRCMRVFPVYADFWNVLFHFTMDAIRYLVTRSFWGWNLDWRDYDPPTDEPIPFSRALAQAKFEYPSVVIDCLAIIATDLGCNVLDVNSIASGENGLLEQLFAVIVRKYEAIYPGNLRADRSKDKAMIAFLPYATRREEDGAVLPISLKYATLHAVLSDCRLLRNARNIGTMIRLWMAAASAVPHTDDIGRSMVGALLGMAYDDELSPHIPVSAWDWLKKRPTGCQGFEYGTHSSVVQMV
ncbi:hypothetical protein BDM02DRAFT_3272666 [Thelephora ganbajun]|uniref:Uncharacterized protein n=1 Tax=Thelephora ganbajun TaxID=370292 RepID=A0ACB6Z3F4_THEGA|nr:hypothetical protein BDM02DRAFT_3272666 [Thelephora ganbajun]